MVDLSISVICRKFNWNMWQACLALVNMLSLCCTFCLWALLVWKPFKNWLSRRCLSLCGEWLHILRRYPATSFSTSPSFLALRLYLTHLLEYPNSYKLCPWSTDRWTFVLLPTSIPTFILSSLTPGCSVVGIAGGLLTLPLPPSCWAVQSHYDALIVWTCLPEGWYRPCGPHSRWSWRMMSSTSSNFVRQDSPISSSYFWLV